MQLSIKARKAVASGLAASSILWAAAGALPQFASAAVHSDGCLVLSGGVVWLITGGTRRGFTSAEVFSSHGHNFSQVVTATAEDAALPVGPIMTYADGTLVKGPNDPLVYLVAGGQKRPFVSASVFLGLGYQFSNVQQAPVNTFADLPTGGNLDSTTISHPQGTVVNASGAFWLMTAAGRMGFPSAAVFTGWGYSFAKVVTANSYDLALGNQGDVQPKPGCTGGDSTPTGSVNVSLNGPAASTLIEGQATATLANFVFSGNGTVTSVTLKRTGVSSDSTLSNVYLFDGAVRLTDAGSVSSGNITFANSSGLFSVSGSKTLSVKSDIAASTSGQTVGVQLTAVVLSSGSVSGLPVSGNNHTVATASLATVAVGAPTAAGASDPGTDIKVWESVFTVGVRDVTFSRLSLRQISNIVSADVRNFRLYVDGVMVGSAVASLDANGYVTFSGFSKLLLSGTRTVKVLADVIGGSSRSIQMSLRNKADVDVMDSQYGVNVAATGTFPASPTATSINSGTMTVTKATDSPSGNVTDTASGVKLGKWTFTAYGESIKVENLVVTLDTNNVDADYTLRNGKVYVNGSQVGSTAGLVAVDAFASGQTFTTNFTVVPGTPATVEVYADIYDEEAAGAELVAGSTLQTSLLVGSSNGTRQTSLTTLNVPTGSRVDANVLTVASGSMTLAAAANYPNQTVVAPQTAFKLGVWNLTGNSTEDVNITSLSLDIDAVTGLTFTSADLSDIYMRYGSTNTSIKPSPTAADNDFSVSFTLVKNAVMTIELYGNIGAAANITDADSVKTDLTVTGTGATSGAAISQADINGQTIIKNAGTFTTSKDASSPDSKLIDDSGTVVVAAYKVAVTNDAYTLTEVDVNIVNATAVQNIILKDGSTTLGTKPGATSVLFAGLSVAVPANTNKILTVELQMSTIGNGAGSTGAEVTATLDSIKHRATSSGVEATDTNDRAANAMYAYKAVPTITNVTLPTSALATGTVVLGKVSVSSGGTGTIGWKKFIFTSTKTGGTAGDPTVASPTLWDADTNNQITGTGSLVSTDTDGAGADTTTNCGETDASCDIVFVATAEQEISGAKTYELRATIGGTPTTGENINTTIAQPSSYVAPAAYATVAATTATFAWSDQGVASHSETSLDWNNGYLVKNLPTNSQTLTK